MNWQEEFAILRGAGVTIAPGLTPTEADRAEGVIGAKFPPDLRAFLSEGLPLGQGFPDWREPNSEVIVHLLGWPFRGITVHAFWGETVGGRLRWPFRGIVKDAFWLDTWGSRPADLNEARNIARAKVDEAPRLIPVAGYCYIPAEPELPGNPVFSVHDTDIIYYGDDLSTYLRLEFKRLSYADAVHDSVRRIRFWSDLVDANT